MATNAIALRDDESVTSSQQSQQYSEVTEVQRLGKLIAASGYFSDAREMAQAAVKVLAGKELGIPPVASMMGINIIKGKIALGGNLIASRIRAHGYDFVHKQFDNTGCILIFLGKKGDENRGHGMLAGRPILGESSFNEADAKAAGLTGNDTYRKFPRNMYYNRSISNGAKWFTPEVFAGAPVYVPEELGARVDENGDMIHDESPQHQTKARQEVLDRKLSEIQTRKQEAADAQIAEEPRAEPSLLDQMLSTFKAAPAIDSAFAQMKEHFVPMFGQEVYDRVMEEGGLGPGQTRTIGRAKKTYAALWSMYQAEKAKIDSLPVEDEHQ